MRTILAALFFLAAFAAIPAATAEPPPQTISLAAVVVTDTGSAAVKADTGYIAQQNTAAPTADTLKADTSAAEPAHQGHGWIWWALVVGVLLAAAVLIYRYVTRKNGNDYTTSDGPPDTTAGKRR